MKKMQAAVLILFICASLSVVIYGIVEEADIGSAGFNGAPYFGMFHYGFDWQPEWLWVAMSVTLLVLEGNVHLVGKSEGRQ